MSKLKPFIGLISGISVLPALMIVPATAEDKIIVVEGMAVNVPKGGSLVLNDENISITSTKDSAVFTNGGSKLHIGGDATESINIFANKYGVAFANNIDMDAQIKARKIKIKNNGPKNPDPKGATPAALVVQKTKTSVVGDDIEIHSDNSQAIAVFFTGAELNIKAKKFEATTDYKVDTAAIHVQNNTTNATENFATFNLNADDITIKAPDFAISALSQGRVKIVGNTQISAESAILARGDGMVDINTDTDNTLKMDGNIRFHYDKPTSGTPINAKVNVTLAGEESYWNGNTIRAYSGEKPTDNMLQVNSAKLTIKNGAVWNATKVIDKEFENPTVENYSRQYVGLNNLNINKGTVNIFDDERGIMIDEADIADATFNGSAVTINKNLNINGGTNIFNSNILGDNATVNIANGATVNIGDSSIDVNTINLDGNMIANLSNRGDKAVVTADAFTGNGKMSLIAKSEGEYKVFGNVVFEGEKEPDSALYDLIWSEDKTSVSTKMKSVADIAGDNGLSVAASQTVVNVLMSDSDKLKDLGLLVQEHLSNGDSEAVEKAHKAINPADTSIVQSVATHVQGAVAKLAVNRMSLPTVMGRNGGDVDLTAGGVWAHGLFNKSKKNGEFSGYTRGVAAGIDGTFDRVFTIGGGYAYNHSNMDLDSRDMKIDSNTLFVYGQYKPSAWYVNATLNYTMSDYKESSPALGTPIDSDYKINAFGGQVMTGYDFANCLTPEAGVRYMHVGGDTYTNSLGVRNKIDDADYLTAILGGKYSKSFTISNDLTLNPEFRLAARYDVLSDEYNTAVAMPGISSYSVKAARLNRWSGEAGMGITMSYKDIDLSLTYDIEFRKDYTSQTGMVQAKYNF